MSDVTPGVDDGGWLKAGAADPDDVASYYDRWARGYDDELATWSYDAPSIVAGLTLEAVPDARSVLDAGCGTGLVGRTLREAGYQHELFGVDISDESLAVAREAGGYTDLRLANLQTGLEFDDDRFDALVCVGVMTYVPDVERCWREFARVVRSGGVVVVTQRDDLWDERDCQGVVDRLAADGVWSPLLVTEARSYLPGNPDFGDEIGVRYVVARC